MRVHFGTLQVTVNGKTNIEAMTPAFKSSSKTCRVDAVNALIENLVTHAGISTDHHKAITERLTTVGEWGVYTYSDEGDEKHFKADIWVTELKH